MSRSPLTGSTGAVSTERSGLGSVQEPSSRAGTASPEWPLVSKLELKALPSAVACGRLHAKHLLWEWQLEHMIDRAEMLVSELLTNAVRASRSGDGPGVVALRLLANRQRVLIQVWDQNPHDPQPMRVAPDAEHGRGFMVVDALANRWGFQRVSANLKVVWCELVVEPAGQLPEDERHMLP